MLQAILLTIAGFFVVWVLVDDLLPGETTEGERKDKGGANSLFALIAVPLLLFFMLLRFAGEAAVLLAKLAVPLLASLFSILRHLLHAFGSLLRTVFRSLRPLLNAVRSFFTRTLGFLVRSLLRGLLHGTLRFPRTLFLRPLSLLFRATSQFSLSLFRSVLRAILRGVGAFLRGLLHALLQSALFAFRLPGMLYKRAGTLWLLLGRSGRAAPHSLPRLLRSPFAPLLFLTGSFALFFHPLRPWNRRKKDALDEERQEDDALSWERMRSIGWHTRARLRHARTA
ncbi:MAG: hypothetical protein WCV62_03825 [Candidatus Peribacteraceae bacterium]|jgi:hypothetical protein